MSDRRLALALAVLALGLYLPAWRPAITWIHYGADGAELEVAARTLGIPHPTGYPLFTLLGRVVGILVPVPVAAVNLLGLIGAVSAVVGTGLASRRLIERTLAASSRSTWLGGFLGGAVLATTLTFWRQALIGEVYTVHLALVAGAWALLLAGGAGNRLLAFYLLGLGLAHHLQTVPVVLVVIAYCGCSRPDRPRLADLGVLLFPLTLYGILILRSGLEPPLDWGDPDRLRNLWWTISGTPYRGNLLADGWKMMGVRTAHALTGGLVAQVGWGGVILGGLGLVATLGRFPRAGAALLVFILGSVVLASAYAIPDPGAYYLPAFLGVALLAGVGATGVLSALGSRGRSGLWGTAAIGGAASAVIVVHAVVSAPGPGVSRDFEAFDYAAESVALLDPDALVVGHGDGHTFALWYAADVLGPRPDVAVLYDNLLSWSWYRRQVSRRHPEVEFPAPGVPRGRRHLLLIERNLDRRPVYLTEVRPEVARRYEIEAVGAFYRVRGLLTGAASSGRTDRGARSGSE